jgi:hypothetical protein
MSHYIVSVSQDIAQRVTPDADTPQDPRFLKVEADSAADAFRLAAHSRADLEAAEPAQEPKPAPAAGHRVKIDQADLFNDQGSLFGHVVQPGDLT